MPKEVESAVATRRVRKGTRSCQECRSRKLKCVWIGEETGACNNCAARSRTCVAQGPALPTFENTTPNARDRIRLLEDEVGALWSVVRRLEANADGGTTHGPSDSGLSYRTPQELDHPRTVGEPSRTSESTRPSGAYVEDNAEDSLDNADSELDGFELSASHQPSHLRQLFDNGLLGSQAADAVWEDSGHRSARPATEMYLTIARRQLQRLLPSREDVSAIAGFTFPWMSIYVAMFPRIRMQTTAEEMIGQYDDLRSPDANPMSLANLLISLALTIRQIPANDVRSLSLGLRSVPRFVEEVSETVDRTIASNDMLAATMDGIETSLLFTRL
jgi:hypothetical protein